MCPSLAAYKTPPFCLLQHSRSVSEATLKPQPVSLEAMPGFFRNPTFHSKTSAVNHAGFPRLLWEMLSQALGCVVNPDYRLLPTELVPHLCRYCAKVLIHLGTDKIGEPVVFEGRPMPTPALTIQTAAATEICRL